MIFICPSGTRADEPISISEFELMNSVLVSPDFGRIIGNYKSSDDNKEFNFNYDRTFTYRLYAGSALKDGALEGSSCALENRNTGGILDQGNFIFYFNSTKCCYDVKLVSKTLLVLARVWEKSFNDNLCPNTNLRLVTKE